MGLEPKSPSRSAARAANPPSDSISAARIRIGIRTKKRKKTSRKSTSRPRTPASSPLESEPLQSFRLRRCTRNHSRRSRLIHHRRCTERLHRDRFHHILQVVAHRDTTLPETRQQQQQQRHLAYYKCSPHAV